MSEITVQIVSISAIVTTIGHLLTGIPICLQIRRQGDVGEISRFPFIMGLLVASFWLRYGLLRADSSLIAVNAAGIVTSSLYNLFFLYYSKPKTPQLMKIVIVLVLIAVMLVTVHFYPNVTYFGFVSTALTFVNFGAPLAGLKFNFLDAKKTFQGVVSKRKEVSTLPFTMCLFTFLVTSQWNLYGFLISDYFIVTTSGVGMIISLVQLSLFLIFPRRSNERSPLKRLFGKMDTNEKDVEVH